MYFIICDAGCRPKPGAEVGTKYSYGSYVILHGLSLDSAVQLHHDEFEYSDGVQTNNAAEYKALIEGLRTLLANILSPHKSRVAVFMDSELVLNQVSGSYKVRKPHLRPLCKQARNLLSEFEETVLTWVPRSVIESYLGH